MLMDDYHVRKAARVAAWNQRMSMRGTGRKIPCYACSGSRYYDDMRPDGSPILCGACNGTGKQWEPIYLEPIEPMPVDISTLTRSQRKRLRKKVS